MGIYISKIVVREEDIDVSGKLSLRALTRMLTDTMIGHRRKAGIGGAEFIKKGFGWVIIFNSIEMERLPIAGEKIIIKTWAGSWKLCMSPQRFEISDEMGNTIIRSSSQWMLFDLKDRKMVMPGESEINVPIIKTQNEKPLPPWKMTFPNELDDDSDVPDIINNNQLMSPNEKIHFKRKTEHVRDEFTDINGHMNNSFYQMWVMEMLDDEFRKRNQPKEMWAEYQKELHAGQEVVLKSIMIDNTFFVRGFCDGVKSFSVKIDF